jgi:hypothetical protein
MDAENTIAEIELLERIHALPDKRPLQMADLKAANQKHDEKNANNPWFRLWKRDSVNAHSGYKPLSASACRGEYTAVM